VSGNDAGNSDGCAGDGLKVEGSCAVGRAARAGSVGGVDGDTSIGPDVGKDVCPTAGSGVGPVRGTPCFLETDR
jgi:hypothetical protein